jgi:hypothetical protein
MLAEVKTFGGWLRENEYLRGNPFEGIKGKGR